MYNTSIRFQRSGKFFLVLIIFTYSCNNPKVNYSYKINENETTLFIKDTEVYLDSVELFENVEINIPIENTGLKLLRISDVLVDCSCTSLILPDNNISPGQKDTLRISFHPLALGNFTKYVSILSNNKDGVITIAISGYVVDL